MIATRMALLFSLSLILTTGLYARDFEAATGRYIQSDPVGLQGGTSTYAYTASTPLNAIDPLGLACNAKGCWNTPAELGPASVGDYAGYYATACAGGDPYACRAGEVATNTGAGLRGQLSHATNWSLAWSIADHEPPICSEDFKRSDVARKMQAIRLGLMQARINQLANATPSSPLQVDRQDIAAFHHSVFENNGAGADAFGGDKWDKSHLQGITGYNWCEAPACTH